jgi:hypothetical protein
MNFTLESVPESKEFQKRDSHLYGIVGVISQPDTIGEGMIAFGGYFRHDALTGKVCDGQLVDCWGQADILNFGLLDKDTLEFNKKYIGRQSVINYKYRKIKGDIWVGEYNGEYTGKGETQCKINLIDNDAFRIVCGSPKKL